MRHNVPEHSYDLHGGDEIMIRLHPLRGGASAPKRRVQALSIFVLTLLVTGGSCLLFQPSAPVTAAYQPMAQPDVTQPSTAYALPSSITASLPANAATATVTYGKDKLLSGRLMLIDRTHPLPDDAAPPNTFNLLAATHGTVTCRDTQAVLGADAISALETLFSAARREHIALLTVMRASVSPQQQRALRVERFCELANTLPLEAAFAQALHEIAPEGTSEHQTAWAVDIRLCDGWDQLPRSEPLSASSEGRWLLENCWRFGFIRRWQEDAPDNDPSCAAYHFRYIGRAHAALMHALQLSLPDYLQLLHRYGTLTLWQNGKPVASVVCAAVSRDLTCTVPVNAALEDVSLDNLGWGVASYLW